MPVVHQTPGGQVKASRTFDNVLTMVPTLGPFPWALLLLLCLPMCMDNLTLRSLAAQSILYISMYLLSCPQKWTLDLTHPGIPINGRGKKLWMYTCIPNYLYLKCSQWSSGKGMEKQIHTLGPSLPSIGKASFWPCEHVCLNFTASCGYW